MKSMMLNVFFPAWEWGPRERPDLRYVSFSYSSTLTERDNEKFCYLVQSQEYQELYGRLVRVTKEGVGRISNTARGWKFASSVGGVGTGERGDRILADDLHKVSEAESELVRGDTVTWFRESMQNRLNDLADGAIIVLGQRVNESDVSGVIIEEYPNYEHLCYDKETEVLTRCGWVKFSDLNPDNVVCSEILAVNPKTLQAQWEFPTKYISYKYTGEMIHYSSNSSDLLVTPDHRMLYKIPNDWKINKKTDWRVAPARDLPKDFYIPQAVNWKGSDTEEIMFGGQIWKSSVLAEFMGWYLSEGCSSVKSCCTRIIQKPGVLADEIEQILINSPFDFRKSLRKSGGCLEFAIGSKSLAEALEPLGNSHTKYVPSIIRSLSPDLLKLFIITFVKGDGCAAGRNGNGLTMSSRSERLIDGIQECCIKSGWAASKKRREIPERPFNGYILPGGFIYTLYIHTSKMEGLPRKWYTKIRKENIKSVAYDDTVYCVSVPSTALVVRRNGIVSVSGNCVPMEFQEPRCETSIGWKDPRTYDGELAWPEKYPDSVLGPYKTRPYLWAGQYQQRPEPRGGGIIKRDYWKIWDREAMAANDVKPGLFPPFEFILASADTAFTEKKENDYSALVIIGAWVETSQEQRYSEQFGTPRLMLIHAWHKRLTLHGRTDIVKMHGETKEEFEERKRQNWGVVEHLAADCRKFKVDKLIIENKASGISVEQEMRRLFSREPWTVALHDPGRMDKVARAYTVQHLFADGLIWRPDTDWAQPVEDELASLPRGAHDDLADAMINGIIHLRRMDLAKRKDESHQSIERLLYGPEKQQSRRLHYFG